MFNSRSEKTEIMDDLNCAGEVVDQTLRELETINRWLGGNSITIDGIRKLLPVQGNQPVEIVDLGCGGGDMLIEIARYGRKKNFPLKLIGIDANPHIIEFAKRNCEAYPEIEFLAMDIFSSEFKELRFDVAIATLVTHHFESTSLSQLCVTLQRQSKLGVVINDLHRHWLAYYSIKVLTLAFSKSSMVKYDAPLSVLRSFKKKEWLQILHQGGITNYSITWKWAFRWQLVIPASLA